MKIIGITGGIASGKTIVGDYLKNRGDKVICADEVYKYLLTVNKKLLLSIKRLFGDVLTEDYTALDRKKLAQIVFSDNNKLKMLNSITHPFVIAEINKFIIKNKNAALIFISAPLLFEAGMDKICDKIICIAASKKNQIQRIIERDKLTRAEALKRISAQLPLKIKKEKSDFVIKNNGDLKNIYKQIDNILKKI